MQVQIEIPGENSLPLRFGTVVVFSGKTMEDGGNEARTEKPTFRIATWSSEAISEILLLGDEHVL
jgi:hypothetical protein